MTEKKTQAHHTRIQRDKTYRQPPDDSVNVTSTRGDTLEASSGTEACESQSVILSFPFGASLGEFDAAAASLKKLGIVIDQTADDISIMLQRKARAQIVNIRQIDADCLDSGQCLNDAMIDFWMEWYATLTFIDGAALEKPFLFLSCLLMIVIALTTGLC